MFTNSGSVTLRNSIVSLNSPGNTHGVDGIESSLVGPDPGFVRAPSPGSDGEWGTEDDDLGDLRLAAGSPAIDTGSNALAVDANGACLTTDMDGNPRVLGGTVDIGAYEHVPPGAHVRRRHVFYNYSAFDGYDAAATAADDNAIAPDKHALLPGQTAAFANYTSYGRGINGIMIDVAGLVGTPTVDDFRFRVGNDANPSGWADGPVPESVTVRPGAGRMGRTG